MPSTLDLKIYRQETFLQVIDLSSTLFADKQACWFALFCVYTFTNVDQKICMCELACQKVLLLTMIIS